MRAILSLFISLFFACGTVTAPDFCDETQACDKSSEAPFCDIVAKQCKVVPLGADSCNSVEPCTSVDAPNCTDDSNGVCVGCFADMHCTDDEICDTGTSTCVGCFADIHCTGDEFCDTSSSSCVGCLAHTDCAGEKLCDIPTNQCVDCAFGEIGDLLCLEADSSTPHCSADSACVACFDSSQCPDPNASVCNLDQFECVPCSTDTQCESGVCESNGQCAVAENILHADSEAASDVANCGTEPIPCKTIGAALAKVTSNKKFILIESGDYSERLEFVGADVELISHGGAIINPELSIQGQTVVRVTSNSKLAIRGLDIAPASSVNGNDSVVCDSSELLLERVGIRNATKFGVNAFFCNTTVLQSTITDNTVAGAGAGIGVLNGSLVMERTVVIGNHNGGLTVRQADYDITNSLFLNNGSFEGDTGGLLFENTAGKSEKFEFSTVSGNEVRNTSTRASGLHCVNSNLQAANNVIVEGSGAGAGPVVDSACSHSFSLLEESISGVGNLVGDPMFENELSFELLPGSPCIDAASPTATLGYDFGGVERPQGAGHDIGANEAGE